MQHSGNAEVLHVRELSRQLTGNIEPSNRLADDLVVGGVFCWGRGVDLESEVLTADQFGIGYRSVAGFRSDHPIRDDQIVFHGAKALCRFVERNASSGCRCLTDLHTTILDRQVAIGRALVRRERSVALNYIDVCYGSIEFVGNDLSNAGADAGTELNLSGVVFTNERADAFMPDGVYRLIKRSGECAGFRSTSGLSDGRPVELLLFGKHWHE